MKPNTNICINAATLSHRYQSYPMMIPKEKDPNPKSASHYGGGVQNEHFIVWMRAAALPQFRKLYGRIEKDLPAGTELSVEIEASRVFAGWLNRLLCVLQRQGVDSYYDQLARR